MLLDRTLQNIFKRNHNFPNWESKKVQLRQKWLTSLDNLFSRRAWADPCGRMTTSPPSVTVLSISLKRLRALLAVSGKGTNIIFLISSLLWLLLQTPHATLFLPIINFQTSLLQSLFPRIKLFFHFCCFCIYCQAICHGVSPLASFVGLFTALINRSRLWTHPCWIPTLVLNSFDVPTTFHFLLCTSTLAHTDQTRLSGNLCHLNANLCHLNANLMSSLGTLSNAFSRSIKTWWISFSSLQTFPQVLLWYVLLQWLISQDKSQTDIHQFLSFLVSSPGILHIPSSHSCVTLPIWG